MTAQPTLSLNFAQARFPDPRITFTRASTGTYIDALGRVRTAAVNQPRFDWDPVSGQCSGLLIEEQRTNLLTYSEDFSKSAWIKTRTTVTTPAIESPDPLSMATKLVADTQSGAHYVEQQFSAQVREYVFHVFVKAAEEVMVRLYLVDPSGSITEGSPALFDLSTGQVVSGPGSIADLGGGWYRITTRGTVGAAGNARARLLLRDGTPYVGNDVDGLYIWGAQLEEGTYPTSYIPTTNSPATRAADTAYVDGEGWLNPAEGTIVVEVREPTGATATTTLLTLSEGASNTNRYSLQGSGSTLRMLRALGGANAYADLGSRAPRGQWNRVAFGYSSAGLIAAANGEVAVNSATMTTPGALSRLYLSGSFAGTAPSWIRNVQYYPVRLSPEELARITA